MSHIFISYSHKDYYELQALQTFLIASGFKNDELWYDKNIGKGEKWNAEIEQALEEAFALVVIMTPNSAKSMYVNHEWSWAKGYGKPVMPLLFKDLPLELQHPVLNYQMVDCRNGIPNDVFDELYQLRGRFTLTKLIDQDVHRMIVSFRALARIAIWVYQNTDYEFSGPHPYLSISEKAGELGRALYMDKMREFWYRNSFVFSRKQKRNFETLLIRTVEYERKLSELPQQTQFVYAHDSKKYLSLIKKVDDFRINDWESAVAKFDNDTSYEALEEYIQKLTSREPISPFERIKYGPLINMMISDLSDEIQVLVKDTLKEMEERFSNDAKPS